ncbi:MAG: SUMF1/EgtB/PvdO family nonheme iron enzyme [Planctomycetaceae bacterium]
MLLRKLARAEKDMLHRRSWHIASETPQRRPAFSRVELLIVLAVAALIVSVTAPALPEIREWSRKQQCHENLRRIGAAFDEYHGQFDSLPPAAYWDESEMLVDEDMRPARNPETVRSTRQNWAQLLLPHLGEAPRGSMFFPAASIVDPANERGRLASLSVMTCPSDDFHHAGNLYALDLPDGSRPEFARGNYAINGGSHGNVEFPGRLSFPVTDGNVIRFRSADSVFQWWGNGVAGFNKCFSLNDFSNGRSTTVLIDEIRAGIVPEDSRGVWALGQIGSSVTWAHGVNADDYGPNNQIADSDDILEGRAISAKYGMERFTAAQMPFCGHCSYSNQATARSRHAAGVNVLLADGASRFISDDVDPGLWHVLHSRETARDAIAELDVELSDREPTDARETRPEPIASQTEPEASPIIVNSIDMPLVLVKPGTFTMGLPDAENAYAFPERDAPPHQVRLTRGYYLGAHEVTQREFEEVMNRQPSWHSPNGGGAALVKEFDADTLPVESVTWNEAVEFCRRLSERPEERKARRTYRLPTEAEWEFACRAGSTRPQPFTEKWQNLNDFTAIAGKEKHPREPLVPQPVGSTAPNAFGFSEMRGNVFEWTADWFDRDYYARSPVDDPPGPRSGYLKVVRGWDWVFIGPQCKDFHLVTPPSVPSRYVGFRVAMDFASGP